MFKKKLQKTTAFFLAVLMIVTGVSSQMAIVASTVDSVETSVTNYADFMTQLKQLEVYAEEYAAAVPGQKTGKLVLNFIRTGVERYLDTEWTVLAGQELVTFTNYVKQQDEENGTSVMALRDIVTDEFILPNGNQVDFGHMFGCMEISYEKPGSADLSGWAGDLCDLFRYCVKDAEVPSGDVDTMAAYIRANCLGVDASEAFGWDDFWGDMDAYYLITEYQKANGTVKFSTLMDAYFTDTLDDTIRTVYFMNNRFAVADNNDAVRKAIYDAYSSDVGISVLESKRGLSTYNALREACCYAIADYIYEKAQGKLIAGTDKEDTASNGYYSVFSDTESVLAPGITQNIKYAQTVDGKQIVYYVATVDINRDDVMIMANYKDNAPDPLNWGMQTVADQVAALVGNYKDQYEYFTPIVATNGNGYNIYTGEPGGLLIMDGTWYHAVGRDGFFAILKTGEAIIGTQADYATYEGKIKEAIGGFGAVLIKDGEIVVTKNANYTASRASRTAIGIKENGEVVMMVLDGRQQPFSAGGSMEEIAQIMWEAGCVEAINLDGGGSTTFLSKPAGADMIGLTNRPSDGYQRMVAASLVAISTAKPSNVFNEAIISSDYEYITAGTSMKFSAKGVSITGNAAPIPDGAYWRVSDETLATIDSKTGVFTASAVGDVTVEFIVDDVVVGSKVIHVVVPDDIKFVEDKITAIYGEPKEIGVTVWYQGYQVAFTPLRDALVFLDYEIDSTTGMPIPYFSSKAGTIEGLTLTGTDANGVRTTPIYAALMIGGDIIATAATVNLYHKNEATFDFDNATSGNRSLAWLREIENARSTDNKLYRVTDPTKPIKVNYTFGLDMSVIEMPAQLEPLKGMLDGGNTALTAWDLLLSFAERICVQTNVQIRVELSPELEVDISNLKILTDYFELTRATLDENNVLTVVCHWKNQGAAIDPATANSLCILTGISATVKDTAAYFNNEVTITNNGTVAYDIYASFSALHSFAQDPANQAQYGLYPFEHSDAAYPTGCRGSEHDSGGHFSSQYADFQDSYKVNKEIRQGWQEEDGEYYFYVDNKPVTGTQLVTDRHDANKLRFYDFDEEGKLVSEQGANGLVWLGEDLYYAILGEAATGWQIIGEDCYYFHPDTGKAVDGKFTIRESKNSWQTGDFEYTFENHILVRGVWEYDTYEGQSGWRYRWAGDWKKACWFEVDGETYHVNKNYPYYVTTGYAPYIKNYPSEKQEDLLICLFDERGALMKDYAGPVDIDGTQMFFMNGVLYSAGIYPRYNGSTWYKGLTQGTDGYYYYVNNDGSVFLGTEEENTKWFKSTDDSGAWANGFVAVDKGYTFDEYGRLTTDLLASSNTTITDATKPTEGESKIVTNVIGRVLSVRAEVTCKVMYRGADGKYHAIEAKVNPYATGTFSANTSTEYNFTVPQDATDVKIVVAGDFSGDGQITNEDIADLQKAALGKDGATLSDEQKFICDANGDGRITAVDLLFIKAAQLGKKPLDW